jgi:acetamidase/formamidase
MKKVKTGFMFTDAQQMHKDYTKTFSAPSLEELKKVKVGDSVKVCCQDVERFWTIVTGVEGDKITATVDNDLVLIEGLKHRDTIEFERKHIYNIIPF